MRKILCLSAMIAVVFVAQPAISGIIVDPVGGGGGGGPVTYTTWQGLTTSTYDGNQTNYAGADALCSADYAGSHVCSVEEILWLQRSGSTLPGAGEGWINDGPPGFTANANDCRGWSINAVGNYGRYWDFANAQGWMRGCSNSVAFACCQ